MSSDAIAGDAEWEHLCKRRFDLRLRALTNRLYQLERQRIMEMREGLVKAGSLIAGSAALSTLLPPQALSASIVAIVVGNAGSLVFGWGNKARDAGKRAAEWVVLDRDIERAGDRTFTEAQLAEWTGRCNEVEAGEPAANTVLLERCYRRACEALGSSATSGGPKAMGWRVPLMIP